MDKAEQQELESILELLKLEKAEDFEQHRKMVQALPLEGRIAKGYTWYPVQVVKTGFAIGDRAYVTIERKPSDEADQFRAGRPVALFTRQAGVHLPEQSGVIHYLDKNKMKIILNSKDLPDWLDMGMLGVDLQFDERSYIEMEKALQLVLKARQDRLAELRSILLGRQPAAFFEINNPVNIAELNPSQNDAINEILASRDVAVVHGPPGTGKTTTLVQAVKLLCQTENTVLVAAPSNAAVDLLTERLADQGLNVVRVGNIGRVDESIMRHTLDVRLAQHPESKHIKKVKIEAAEARRQARRFRRRFGPDERDERKHLLDEAKALSAWANQLEDRLIEMILDSAQVITCTLVGATHPVLDKRAFRTVVIDEAAQALEPATWIPVTKASKIILAGDPFQLPPTVKSLEAQRQGLSITLIEKSLQRQPRTSLLRMQYRMHEHIMGFSNQYFYNGALEAAPEVKNHQLPIAFNTPVVFIDTAGCGFEEKIHENGMSRYNPEEFHILCEHLYQLVEAFHDDAIPSIAIISPYKEQVIHIQDFISNDTLLSTLPLSVNTIDGFQGQERDIVYISLVRSNGKSEIGFLSDYRRMNVAMTRARKQLIIVGDSATIGNNHFYAAFLEYCEAFGAYQTAWEYMM